MKLENRIRSLAKLFTLGLIIATHLQAQAVDAEALFVRRIWPLFQEKCLACHGNDEAKIKGGLDMRTLSSTLKGGDSEVTSLIPGKAAASPLYLATTRTHEDWEAMPPKENDKLSQEQVDWIKEWITSGAPWPDETKRMEIAKASADKWSAEDGIIVKTVGALSPDWANRRYKPEALWAYQPVKKPSLDPKTKAHPIDAWVELHMPPKINPASKADARTLIRRATFDLTGLPPTPEEVESFVHETENANGSNEPYVKLINRLLDSPHYGERMARHWLDVVRYADSSGFANDYERGNAWRYRDYVVRSFNEDKPYDQFIKEQIAGDEMAEQSQKSADKSALTTSRSDLLIATGFLRMGPWELTGMEVAKIARQRFLDDVTNSVGETFLSHSLQCARCHDHKFDPIPTHDYYAMQACFSTTQLAERPAPFTPSENATGFAEKKYLEASRDEHLKELQSLDEIHLKGAIAWYAEQKLDRQVWDQEVAQARKFITQGGKTNKKRNYQAVFDAARSALQKKKLPEAQIPPKGVGFEPVDYGRERVARKGLERLKWQMERYEPFAFSVYDGRTPQMVSVYQPLRIPADPMKDGELEQTAILGGGDPFSLTTPVKPSALSALFETANIQSVIPDQIEGRRAALANWIADPNNPLTTRSIVNRLWLWHFGQAIAGNPNNFGSTGKRPTHPELLDWLAAAFVEKGWSFKEMHRAIMTSEAYQRSAHWDEETKSETSRGELESAYAVFKPRRLTAEELRDTMLSVTGELNPTLGGIPNRPEINVEVAMQPRQVMGTFASAWVPNPMPEQRHRRSLYALKLRGVRDPFMEVFNEPGPDFSCEAREVSTVTPQVFSLFNGQASYDRALALANRVLKEQPNTAIQRVFELTYGRAATAEEVAACEDHWQKMEAKQKTLSSPKTRPPLEITREAVEENTGEKFSFREKLHAYADFVPDLQASDVDAHTRALADVCLVLLNSNEFAYVY